MSDMVTADYVGTFSGKRIDLLNTDPDHIEIVDVAVGLSQQCRYAGQVWPFYSVAEHSVLVSLMMPPKEQYNRFKDLDFKALLHDAPEFILGDVIRPVKRRIANYDVLESRVMSAICKRYDFEISKDEWIQIKKADDAITIAEREKLMPRLDTSSYGKGFDRGDVPNIEFKCMTPPAAALAFLSRFFSLSNTHPTREQTQLINVIKEFAR